MKLYVDWLSGLVSNIVKKFIKYYTIVFDPDHSKHSFDVVLTDIMKQCTHLHSLPPMPTHPNLLKIFSHPLHPPKIFSHSSPLTQNNA